MADTPTILARIVAGTRQRLASAPPNVTALEGQIADRPLPPSGLAALRSPGIRIIAEVKRRSPSAGTISVAPDPASVARVYAAHGAAAISVLTEPDHFGGSLADLAAVSAAVPTPCLRKDFIVDERQLLEARAAGASLVLLIAGVLTDAELKTLRERGEALGMTALVEAHDATEARRAVDSGARVVGINNRDLRTFDIDLHTAEKLRPLIPTDVIAVAESGIHTRADVTRLVGAGYTAFLVGTALMRASDPGAALAGLIDPTVAPPPPRGTRG